jgi:hypothetical protein
LEQFSLTDHPLNQFVTPQELSRRRAAGNQRVFLRILVNGNYVTRTRKRWIQWPLYEVNFNEKFQLFVLSRPNSIRLQVVMGGMLWTKTIADFEIPIPG